MKASRTVHEVPAKPATQRFMSVSSTRLLQQWLSFYDRMVPDRVCILELGASGHASPSMIAASYGDESKEPQLTIEIENFE